MASALEEAEAAIALDPKLAKAHLMRGAARLTIGDLDAGFRSVERAVELGRDDASLHLDAAILLLSMGRQRVAAALAKRSAALAPDQFGADLLLARILSRIDPRCACIHCEKALKKVRKVLADDPEAMRARYALGPLLAQLGDYRAAQAALESIAHHESALEYYRAVGFAQIGDVSSSLERLGYLASRGWRRGCIIDKDDGFASLYDDQRFQKLDGEPLAA